MSSGFSPRLSKGSAGRYRVLLWLVPVIVIAGCLTLWWSWGHAAEPESAGHGKHAGNSVAEPPVVRLIEPPVRKIVRVVGQPSFVEAYERTSIYPKMTAYVEKWNVDIGDPVKKNDVLATLFVPEWVEDWGTKKATVKLDQEKVELARKLVKVAEADVKTAEARLKEAKAILGKYEAEVVRWDTEVKRLRVQVKNGTIDPQILLESEYQWRSTEAAKLAADADILKADAELLSRKAELAKDIVAVDVASADLKVAESEAARLKAAGRLPDVAGAVRRDHHGAQCQHRRLRAAGQRRSDGDAPLAAPVEYRRLADLCGGPHRHCPHLRGHSRAGRELRAEGDQGERADPRLQG